MNQKVLSICGLFVVLTLLLSACQLPAALQLNGADERKIVIKAEVTSETSQVFTDSTLEPTMEETSSTPTEELIPNLTEVSTRLEETQAPLEKTYGPTDFPENVNPLTGLPVPDPALLKLPPALISISNFPASARPQAGINASPWVFEMAIGEGMTRFLALFYGRYPELVSGQTEGQTVSSSSPDGSGGQPFGDGNLSGDNDDGAGSGDTDTINTMGETASIGPIRSGRLPYEGLRSIYSGFLVMASAYKGVAQTLNAATSIYGSDDDDINSAMIDVTRLQSIAQTRAQGYPGSNFSLEGLKFSIVPPEGGRLADHMWVFYSSLNQVQWQYDAKLGAYVRYDIKTDGSEEYVMATDRITGEPVSRENVIVIFAEHNYLAPTLIDIALTNMPPMKAVLFRDGEMYEIFWTTRYGDYEKRTGLLRPMRFEDAAGNPLALKNGYTWVEIVSTASYFVESALSDNPFYPINEAEGTGLWLVRYKGTY